MAFMEQEIIFGRFIVVDTDNGTEIIPFDTVFNTQNKKTLNPKFSDIKDYLQVSKKSQVHSIEIQDGFAARLSAPGYMDCTEWALFQTEELAKKYLEETYGED